MAISELQIALLGAGAAAVAAVWGYNAWQERKHRKVAENIFKGGQGDALLGDETAVTDEPPRREPVMAPTEAPMERIEPGFLGDDEAEIPDTYDSVTPEPAIVATPTVAESTVSASPQLPGRWADPIADCVLRFSVAEAVPAPAVWAAQSPWAGDLSKTFSWLAIDKGQWKRIDDTDTGRYCEWAVALQLADRRGAITDGELARYFDGMQQVAAQLDTTLELPSRGETVLHASKLDQFCATVDIQFALYIVEASGGTFAGTKLRGVAEASGLRLEDDGVFRARDEDGGELYALGNLGPEKLDPDTIKSLATHGLTLSIDVPRTPDGGVAFNAMLTAARQLTKTLGGVLVDTNRQPLAEPMIQGIRAKTIELQQSMRDAGIEPGSVRALRLFS